MPKTKSLKSQVKKSKPSTKGKVAQTKPTNYLSSIQEILTCMEKDKLKLQKQFDVVPTQIEKGIAKIKTNIKNSQESQKKIQPLLMTAKKKEKEKSNPKNKEAIQKFEKMLTDEKSTLADLNEALKTLTLQLQTIKKLKQEQIMVEKLVAKAKADLAKETKKKPKPKSKQPKLTKGSQAKEGNLPLEQIQTEAAV